MAYKAFFSHSMSAVDLGFVYEVAREAHAGEITCYIAERDYQLGVDLPTVIEANIRNSDCMIVFLTQGGVHSAWVNQEVGFARACKKLIIPVVEKGVSVPGFIQGLRYLALDRSAPFEALAVLREYLGKLKSAKEQQDNAMALLVIGGVFALLLLANGGKSEGGTAQ